jgi:hypothetical protein
LAYRPLPKKKKSGGYTVGILPVSQLERRLHFRLSIQHHTTIMAPRDAAVGSKRKLTDRTKDKSSKKPKVEKRAKPQRQEASDGISDTSAFEDFSDDPEDGGAPLSNGKSQKSDKQYNGSKADDAQAGKVFERGLSPYSS